MEVGTATAVREKYELFGGEQCIHMVESAPEPIRLR
jgi:hypothetical protein